MAGQGGSGAGARLAAAMMSPEVLARQPYISPISPVVLARRRDDVPNPNPNPNPNPDPNPYPQP